jgi:hypothetical protein
VLGALVLSAGWWRFESSFRVCVRWSAFEAGTAVLDAAVQLMGRAGL